MLADNGSRTGGTGVYFISIEDGSHNGQEDQDQLEFYRNQGGNGVNSADP